MKLVSFAIETWLGPMRRIGALIDGEQDGCIADFTSAYTNYFAAGNRCADIGRAGAIAHTSGHDRLAQRWSQIARSRGVGAGVYSPSLNGMTGLLKPPAD
jgi:hypothetical protein